MVNMSSKFVYDDDTSRNCPSSSPPRSPGPSEPKRPKLDEAPGNDVSARNKPGFTPTAPGPASGPALEQTSGPTAAVARNTRGCRFSSVLNSLGVRCECTSDRDEDCCHRCCLSHYSVPGSTLLAILEEVYQPGLNNPRGGSNRRANESRAGSLANSGLIGKPADCSAGHDQVSVPAERSLQATEPDEPTARSMVDCMSEAFRMIERLYQRLVFALCIVVVLFICAVVFVVLISKM